MINKDGLVDPKVTERYNSLMQYQKGYRDGVEFVLDKLRECTYREIVEHIKNIPKDLK